MARMSRKQYELLTEALGHGLYKVRKEMPQQDEASVWMVITELAAMLKDDNQNFNSEGFTQGVSSVASLDELADNGLTIH